MAAKTRQIWRFSIPAPKVGRSHGWTRFHSREQEFLAAIRSDTVSASFQYEIRLDEVVSADFNGTRRAEGALELNRPLQELFQGLYFPIPEPLIRFLVPKGNEEIRLDLSCDWYDMRSARHWATDEKVA